MEAAGRPLSGSPPPPPCSRPPSPSPWSARREPAKGGRDRSRGMTAAPVTWQQRCYEAMPGRRTWAEIAEAAGLPRRKGDTPYRRGSRAQTYARRYAASRNLPYPPVGCVIRGRGRPDQTLDRARRAYELRAKGERTWRSIALELGYSTANEGRTALEMARRYASGAGLPWPPGRSQRHSRGGAPDATTAPPGERATAIRAQTGWEADPAPIRHAAHRLAVRRTEETGT